MSEPQDDNDFVEIAPGCFILRDDLTMMQMPAKEFYEMMLAALPKEPTARTFTKSNPGKAAKD